jgi:acrylyl-CoA reductase (NADPH)
MPSAATDRFVTLAASVGVHVEVAEFPEGTRTATDAARAVGCDVDAIVKSLVFMADGQPVLVLMRGGGRVDEQRLAGALGATDVRRASADEARAATGYAIGGTPPLGHHGAGVTAIIADPSLLAHDRVWAAAGTPSSVFPISPTQLVEASGARVADVAERSATLRALMVRRPETDATSSAAPTTVAVEELDVSALPEGAVTIAVTRSSLNYKDALVLAGHPGLVREHPHVPGIDLAGTVEASSDPAWSPGDEVLVTGCWLGERHWGGMATRARVPAEWVVARPAGMDAQRAMALGTAGFTAQLAVDALLTGGVRPDGGPVLVTGASGGVGAIAVMVLAAAGFEVDASTGSAGDPAAEALLVDLGAARILPREDVSGAAQRPLASARWAGVIDVAGGATLAGALAQTRPRGVVAACGLADDTTLATSVMPFIVRGIQLVGIDSVLHPVAQRADVWARLHAAVPDELLTRITMTVALDDVRARAAALLDGHAPGRTVVDTETPGAR